MPKVFQNKDNKADVAEKPTQRKGSKCPECNGVGVNVSIDPSILCANCTGSGTV